MSENLERPRWAVELLGNEFDLSGARIFFGHEGCVGVKLVRLATGREATLLTASEFEKCDDAGDVIDAADRLTDFLNGILYLMDADRVPLRTNGVYERRLDGEWGNGIVFGSSHMTEKSRMRILSSADPGAFVAQQSWVRDALEDEKVSDVLAYLRGTPDWFDLYKAHETIGAPSDKFTETAQAMRHSKEWCRRKGVRRHMSIEEAREHVRLLAKNWLESRSRKM